MILMVAICLEVTLDPRLSCLVFNLLKKKFQALIKFQKLKSVFDIYIYSFLKIDIVLKMFLKAYHNTNEFKKMKLSEEKVALINQAIFNSLLGTNYGLK